MPPRACATALARNSADSTQKMRNPTASLRGAETGFAKLHPPPPSPLFWHSAETVEKGPPLAWFFISAQTDSGLRSRNSAHFHPPSPAPNFPFLARFRETPVLSQGRGLAHETAYEDDQALE